MSSDFLICTLAALAVGYLAGSLPFGYWVARAHGIDIFKAGSGNPGATNVKRVVGRRAGNLVFLLDFLKGFAATGWPLLAAAVAIQTEMAVAGLVGAITGHSFSCFTRFRGGKGVATSIGGLLALMPAVTAVALGVWAAVFFLTRYVSLASVCFAVSLPAASIFLGNPGVLRWFSAALAAFIILRHQSNIRRLIAGTEPRFERKNAAVPPGR